MTLDLPSALNHLDSHWLTYQVTDILQYEDFTQYAHQVLSEGRTLPSLRHDPHPFPIPKEGGGFRTIALLDPADELMYQAVAEEFARRVDPLLGDDVYSYRMLRPERPAEFLQRPLLANAIYRNRMLKRYSEGYTSLGTADVKNFYPSLTWSFLETHLAGLGMERSSIDVVKLIYEKTQAMCGGLPQGPEASNIIANSVLMSVDRIVHSVFSGFYGRYADDMKLLGRDPKEVAAALRALIAAVDALGLRINRDKVELLNEEDARARIHDSWKELIKYGQRVKANWVEDKIHDFFDQRIKGVAKPAWTDSRYALSLFEREVDAHALSYLVRTLEKFRGAGAQVGRYLQRFGIPMGRESDFFESLAAPHDPTIEHLRHHLLQSAGRVRAGIPEFDALEELVHDDQLPSLNRAWICRLLGAWRARTKLKNLEDLVGDEIDSVDGQLIRGVLAGLGDTGVVNEALLNRIWLRRPEYIPTILLVEKGCPPFPMMS